MSGGGEARRPATSTYCVGRNVDNVDDEPETADDVDDDGCEFRWTENADEQQLKAEEELIDENAP